MNSLRRTLHLFIGITAWLYLPAPPAGSLHTEITASTLSPSATLPSLQDIKSCIHRRDSAQCLDLLFRQSLRRHSTLEILQLLRTFEAEDPDYRRDCHPVVHAVGRETYRLKGTIHDAFSACDQTCHSGCYHGSVERFLRGENIYAEVDRHPSAAELKEKAASACDPNVAVKFRFQCLHGLGHALLFFTRYNLQQALDACDVLADAWSRSSCYGGVFMENVFNATPERRNLSPVDFHYPCSRLDAKYRGDCYTMQTSRMTEMGLSTEQIFRECEKAGEFRSACEVSLGRDLSNFVRAGQIRAAARKCELASGESRLACVSGVVYALIDNTWDGRYALPFCAALGGERDQTDCYALSVEYLAGTFDKSPADIIKDCAQYVRGSARCVKISSP